MAVAAKRARIRNFMFVLYLPQKNKKEGDGGKRAEKRDKMLES